jgi:hypothetical protein
MDVREKLVELLEEIPHPQRLYPDLYVDRIIEKGVTVQEWIPVTERLPEDASTVLAVDSDGTTSSAYYVGRWHSGGDLDEDAVTNWMPLPEAPKGE